MILPSTAERTGGLCMPCVRAIPVPMHRDLRFVLVFAIVHAVAGIAALMVSFNMGMARFETGMVAGSLEGAVDLASKVLLWPLFIGVAHPWMAQLLPGPLGYVPIALNSLLTGVVTLALVRSVQNRGHRGTEGTPSK